MCTLYGKNRKFSFGNSRLVEPFGSRVRNDLVPCSTQCWSCICPIRTEQPQHLLMSESPDILHWARVQLETPGSIWTMAGGHECFLLLWLWLLPFSLQSIYLLSFGKEISLAVSYLDLVWYSRPFDMKLIWAFLIEWVDLSSDNNRGLIVSCLVCLV